MAPKALGWLSLLSLLLLLAPGLAHAARVQSVAPSGTAEAPVRQVSVQFDRAVVPAGDPTRPAPFTLACSGAAADAGTPAGAATSAGAAPPAARGRWANERLWVLDLFQPLPAGQRCTLELAPGFAPMDGALQGPTRFSFDTGAPSIVQIRPGQGARIEEDQHFWLRLNGAIDPASLANPAGGAWCEVQGLGERMPVVVVDGPPRAALLRREGIAPPPARAGGAADTAVRSTADAASATEASRWLLLRCQRPLPPEAGVRLVWGPGIAAAGQPTLRTRSPRAFEWRVREPLLAEFSCTRENARAPCMPLRALEVRFSAPVPRALALAVRLEPLDGGEARAPQALQTDADPIDAVRFAPPFAERSRWRVVLPAELRDDNGRPLANAASFPLTVALGDWPPLAKFAAAPFGILEAGSATEPALLPMTLRHVQADLVAPAPAAASATPTLDTQGAARSGSQPTAQTDPQAAAQADPQASAPSGPHTGGTLRRRHFGADSDDATLMRWLARVQAWHERSVSAREAGLPEAEWSEPVVVTDARGRTRTVQRERWIGTRELSLLREDGAARSQALPRPPPPASGSTAEAGAPAPARATEVFGLPLPERGLHIVEAESRVLGDALLASRAPMFVRSAVLVTGLAVHFKHGPAGALVWVTALERARPVAGAHIVVNDCRGRPLWRGRSDRDGLAAIPHGFSDEDETDRRDAPCLGEGGLFVSARQGGDVAFVNSRWQRGIESWRFGIPVAWRGWDEPEDGARLRAHTVFDRVLLRAGETVSMKHFVRVEAADGLRLPGPAQQPVAVRLTHVGSGAELDLPLAGGADARASESRWAVPLQAALGLYDVALRLPADGAGAHGREGSGGADRAGGAGGRTSASPGAEERPGRLLSAGSFRVEAFRVPLLDARLHAPPPAETIAPATLALQAQVQLFAGGPLADWPLELSAMLRARPVRFEGFDDFRFDPPRPPADAPGGTTSTTGGEADEDGPADPSTRLLLNRQPARSDAQGAAQLSVPALPPLTGPAELLAEMSLLDPNGEVHSVVQRVPLWPAALVTGIRLERWAAQRGRQQVELLVLDTEGRPLAGRAIELEGRLQRTLSTRTRLVGGFYAYDHRRETEPLGVLCRTRSDARGRAMCALTLQRSGEVELVARARDDAGRVAESAASLWVAGDEALWFAQGDDDRIELLPEQREVAPGESVRIQVRTPFREATALVTVEREGVLASRVMTLRASDPVITLPVPRRTARGSERQDGIRGSGHQDGPRGSDAEASASWAPNVVVSVLLLRGRLREAPWWSAFTWGWREPAQWWRAFRHEDAEWQAPTALADLARPAHRIGATTLRVGLAEHRLDVQVRTDRSTAAPRESVRATVRVAQGGRPLAGAEVAFAAVDEGLLALQPNDSWDLLAGLMPQRGWAVQTATAQGEVIGRRHYGRKALPAGGGGGHNPTRELFDTLLLWEGRVTLDARGEVRLTVPLNDSLTRFRLVAIADAPGVGAGGGASADTAGMLADRFGTGSASVTVTQDLQLLPGIAPLAREGDRFDAGLTLRNTTERAMRVAVTLAARSDAAGDPALPLAPRSVDLPAGAALELHWPVQVPAGATRLEWTAEAAETGGGVRGALARRGRSASDRVRVLQAVVPAVPERVWQARLEPLAAPLSLPVAAPAGALPGRGGVQVGLLPRLAEAPPGLRRWFEAYAWTCLEQRSARALALDDRRALDALAAELPGYLDADGLAAFFPPRPGDPPRGDAVLTAHLLSAAHAAGWAWPAPLRERMLQGLAAFVTGRLERETGAATPDAFALGLQRLAALATLVQHDRAEPRMLDVIRFEPARWPSSTLLDAWAVWQGLPAAPQAAARRAQIEQALRQRLTRSGPGSAWQLDRVPADQAAGLFAHPDADAARLLLAAIAAAEAAGEGGGGGGAREVGEAWDTLAPELLRSLLARQRGGAWATTPANLWAALALRAYAERFERETVDGHTRLALQPVGANGAARTPGEASATGAPGVARPSAPAVPSRIDAFTLAWQAGPAGGTALLPWPGGEAVLDARHLGSGRPWLSVQALAAVPLTEPVSAGYRVTRTVTPLQPRRAGVFSRGDLVRVTLRVEAAADAAWVVWSDPIPAGATLLGSGLGGDSAVAGELAAAAARAETRSADHDRSRPAWPRHVERSHEAWRAYFEWLPRGTHTLSYTLRLNTAGEFGLPPTRIEAMYAPDRFGELPLAPMAVER